MTSAATKMQTRSEAGTESSKVGDCKGTSESSSLVVTLVLFLSLAAAILCYGLRVFDLGHKLYGEGAMLAVSERMRAGPVSVDWLRPPMYTLNMYGPAYYWATDLLSAELPGLPSLVPGRLVSLGAFLLTAGLIAAVVWRKTRNVSNALFAGLLYVVCPLAYFWIPAERVDALAVFFAVMAVAAAGRSRSSLVLSALLVASGSLVKQTAAFSAVAVFLHLLIYRRYRDAAWYAVLVSALGAAFWLSIDAVSGGYYMTSAIKGSLHKMELFQGVRNAAWVLIYPVGLAALAITAANIRVGLRQDEKLCLFSLAFLTSLLYGTIHACKEATYINVFLEMYAQASVLIGLYGFPRWGGLAAWPQPRRWALAYLILVAPNLFTIWRYPGEFHAAPARPLVRSALLSVEQPGLILCSAEWVDEILACGRQPLINDLMLYRQQVDCGVLSIQPLLSALQKEEVPLVIFTRSLQEMPFEDGRALLSPIETVLEEHYRLSAEGPGAYVYKPRAAAQSGRPAVPATSRR